MWIYLLLQNLKLKVTKYINFRLTMWCAISDLHIFGTYNCFPRNLADNLISGSFYLPESVSQLWVLLTIYFWKDRRNILKNSQLIFILTLNCSFFFRSSFFSLNRKQTQKTFDKCDAISSFSLKKRPSGLHLKLLVNVKQSK